MGFTPTFSRYISYGTGGLTISEISRIHNKESRTDGIRDVNGETLGLLMLAMRPIYVILGLVSLILMATLGTWSVYGAISRSSDPVAHWIAWVVTTIFCSVILYGNYYVAFLQGTNQIALLQQVRIATSLMALIATSLVVLMGSDLLNVVLTYQSLTASNVLINALLVSKLNRYRIDRPEGKKDLHDVWRMVWPSAWKSAVGIVLSSGLIQVSGIIYAQVGTAEQVATYLLSLQLILAVSAISQAPFYTSIPLLARQYAERKYKSLVETARVGMRRSYLVYVIGVTLTALLGPHLLDLIHSSVNFPRVGFWALIGGAFFFERFGAMHLQLYSVTNQIVWHIANGVTGLIMVVSVGMLYPIISEWSFPVSMLSGYLGFYAWYSARRSYRELELKFFDFEKTLALPALFALCLAMFGVELV